MLGDTQVDLIETPGHTPGTLSLVFPVTDGDTQHRAVLWGGTAFNFGPDAARYEMYANSAERMRHLVLKENVDVFVSNHPGADNSLAHFAALDHDRAIPNPFVMSSTRVSKGFEALRECATAARLALPANPSASKN